MDSETEQKALTVAEQANALKVVDVASYEAAGKALVAIKAMIKAIDASFDPIKKQALDGYRATCASIEAEREKHAAPLLAAQAYLTPQISTFLETKERERREQERKLQEEARKLAETEALARAEEAAKAGNHAEAEAALDDVRAPVVVITDSTPKVSGLTIRETWNFRIMNPAIVPNEYRVIDTVAIGRVVRALKGNTNIPGVEVYSEKKVTGARQ